MSQDVVQHQIDEDVEDGGTIVLSYPAGRSAGNYARGRHYLISNTYGRLDDGVGVSFSFGVSTIVVTNSTGLTLVARTEFLANLDIAGYSQSADISTAVIAAATEVEEEAVFLRVAGDVAIGDGGGGVYGYSSAEPDHGGKVRTADGAWWERLTVDVGYDWKGSSLLVAPAVDAEAGGDPNGLPDDAATRNYFNVVVAPGFVGFPAGEQAFWRSTFLGHSVGSMLEGSERTEAIGNASLKYARFTERNTLVGSLTGQWFGQDLTTDPAEEFYLHDLFWNAGVPVSDVAWDAFGLETAGPGIRAQIAAFTDWAEGADDIAYNVMIGRDAGVEMVRGLRNVAVGYRAGGLMLEADDNVAVGVNAMFMGVFAGANVAVGKDAAYKHQTGDFNTYVGRTAGYAHVGGASNVIIGVNAGNTSASATWTGDWNVMIGQDAGRQLDGTIASTINNRLYVQDRYTRNPLLCGHFDDKFLGINTPIATGPKGPLHVYAGASGSAIAVVAEVGTVVVEHDDNAGILVVTPNSKIGAIYFGDPQQHQQGGVSYNHATDEMRLRVANANGFVFGAAGKLSVPSLPSSNPGAGTKQFWYDPADGDRVKFSA
jgi:hypothetical protein